MPKLKKFNGVEEGQLIKLLVENKFLTEKEAKAVSSEASEKNIPVYNIILQKDLISDENLGKLISEYLKLPFVTLTKVSIPADVLHIVPGVVAQKQKIIVFKLDEKGVCVATSNPEHYEAIEFISKKTGEEVKRYFATEKDIESTLSLYKKELQKSFDELLKEQVSQADKADTKEVPITKIVDLLLEYASDNQASDIHIEPFRDESSVRFRIDGVLHDVLTLPKELHLQVITRIKVASKLQTDEHLAPQDGKLQFDSQGETVDVRVSVVPVVHGEKTVLRLLSSRSRQFSLSDLGMSEKDLEKVELAYEKPFGMILSTGPTGSGKTTTIYAIVKILNVKEKNIATIEDPVEYDVDGINQIQVNQKTDLTFANGLRSILRQDPNIIFVGEIRDHETADIAINSALTGHLVLSTLHTNNAATTLPRLIDMGVEPFLVSSTVNLIIAQRLVRKICESCKVSYSLTQKELANQISTT